MLDNISTGSLIQLCHLLLTKPQRFLFKPYINPGSAVIVGIYDHIILGDDIQVYTKILTKSQYDYD